MSGHTPGPWEVLPESDGHEGPLNIVSEYEEKGGRASANWIAECDLQERPETNWANARLIAAAPELLEALKALVDSQSVLHETTGVGVYAEDCPGDDTCRCSLVAQVNAAIAKAEGR